MANRHGAKSTLRALNRKMKTLSFPKKMKLTGRMISKPFGNRKPLYLGGYYDEDVPNPAEEERIRRCHEENIRLRQNSAGTMSSGEKSMKEGTDCGSYIAIAADSLDKGGLERVIELLANEWKKLGKEVKVFCIRSGGETAEKLKDEAGVEVLIFDFDTDKLREYITKNPPLVVNTHFLHEGIEVFYERGIPIVEVIHNMYVFLDYGQWCFEERKYGYVDQYVAVSGCAKDDFLKKFPDASEEKITVIGNAFGIPEDAAVSSDNGKADPEIPGSETDNDLPDRSSRMKIRNEFKIPGDAFIFLSAGSIDPRKNNLGMVKAFAGLRKQTDRECRLLLAGSESDEAYAKKVRKLVEKEKLQDSVIFAGQRSDVSDLMKASDAMLMISYFEGWSVAATEAIAAGLPIIHSRCGSAEELICGGQNGILVDNPVRDIAGYSFEDLLDAMEEGINENPDEVMKAMLSMIRDENEWKQRRKEIARFATEHFDSEKVAKEYLTLFSGLLKEMYNMETKT